MQTSKHTAIAKCKACGEYIISSGGGDFERCGCGKSFIDQERFSGRHVRMGGEADFIEQICPETCQHVSEHSEGNWLFPDVESLDEYMRETYNAVWENGKFKILTITN